MSYKVKFTPAILQGVHHIYGDIDAVQFDGSENSALLCASLHPSIVTWYDEELTRWRLQVPTIAGEFHELDPGDYAGLTVNDRVIYVMAEEAAV